MLKEFDVIIIGAGAAGLMCAQLAGHRGKKVLLLEHNDRVGKKILISGGGRCNFTNLHTRAENFISENPHFCKSALARYSPQDFLQLVEKHRIPYFEKKLGQLFCQVTAKQITEMLLKECREAAVEIGLNCKVESIHRDFERNSYKLKTSLGAFQTQKLVIATGALSFPNLGASDFAYKIARQFKLEMTELRPGLVPLLFNPEDARAFTELSGVSLDVLVTKGQHSFRENILFTHRGLSGPAILQISSYWKKGEKISLCLLPDVKLKSLLMKQKNSGNKSELKNILAHFFPKRFSEIWCELRLPSRPLVQISDKDLNTLADSLQNWEFEAAGDEGYSKAEVTRGGISTDELSSQNMECKKLPGLFFIGECVDVTGWLGGFNFQWAWASANACAQSL